MGSAEPVIGLVRTNGNARRRRPNAIDNFAAVSRLHASDETRRPREPTESWDRRPAHVSVRLRTDTHRPRKALRTRCRRAAPSARHLLSKAGNTIQEPTDSRTRAHARRGGGAARPAGVTQGATTATCLILLHRRRYRARNHCRRTLDIAVRRPCLCQRHHHRCSLDRSSSAPPQAPEASAAKLSAPTRGSRQRAGARLSTRCHFGPEASR
jgi:hypothetical protein